MISGCFAYELGVVKPNWGEVGKGFIPKPQIITDRNILYAAIGILGATVMPHNLFLHSSLVQTRQYPRTPAGALLMDCLSRSSSALTAFSVDVYEYSSLSNIHTSMKKLSSALIQT